MSGTILTPEAAPPPPGRAGELVAVIAYPLVVFLQLVPKIAVAPLFVVWFGFRAFPKGPVHLHAVLLPGPARGLALAGAGAAGAQAKLGVIRY